MFGDFIVFIVCFRDWGEWGYFYWYECHIEYTCFTFDNSMLWSVVIGLMNVSHPIDTLRWVSNISDLIHTLELRRSTMMISSPFLNWFSVSADSILCWENIVLIWFYQGLLLYSERSFCIHYQWEIILGVQSLFILCTEFDWWVQDFHGDENVTMYCSDVDCCVSWSVAN